MIFLLGTTDNHSNSSLLELDMGSDSSFSESASESPTSIACKDDDVLVSMLVQLEDGLFKQEEKKKTKKQTNDKQPNDDVPPPPPTMTPQTARRWLQQVGESFSCDCLFTPDDLVRLSITTNDDDDDDDDDDDE
jgi:hypothetical protein